MKVAILTPGGVDRSGTERVIPCLLWLIERLVRRGHDVHVFATGQEPAPGTWSLLGATVHNAGRRPRGVWMLKMLLAEHRRRQFDVVHAFWAQSTGVSGAAGSRLLGVPLLLTLPGADVVSHPAIRYGGTRRWSGRAKLRIAAAAAHVVTTPSGAMTAHAALAGVSALRVPLGVDLDKWPPLPPRARAPGEPLRLLHVGNLNLVKDQGTLLRAMALLKDRQLRFALEVIGFDTLGGAVQRLAAELRLEGMVHFRGFLPHAELRPWFERADLLVVSSIHEAGPLVMLEAAVAGVPTVGTAVGHIADFAPDAAVAVPVGDAEALAGAIAELASDEPHRLRIAAAAQLRATSEDADYTANRISELYERACAPSGQFSGLRTARGAEGNGGRTRART